MNNPMRIYAKVNLNDLEDNMAKMKANLKPDTGMMAVVKANAYGHGSREIAKTLQKLEYVNGFCVATVEEAIEIRDAGITKPILVLGHIFKEDYDLLAEYDLMPAFFRTDCIEALNECGMKHGKPIKVHVKVDTGMSRIGIAPDESGLDFVEKVLQKDYIAIEGIFTHFARADEKDLTYANMQFDRFTSFVSKVENRFAIKIPNVHCSNSAGIITMPKANLNNVRPGITVYGLSPSDEVKAQDLDLKPILSLYSHVSYVKDIASDTAISYGGTFVSKEPMRVATIPVGYADGYPRGLSNKGYVLIRGQKAPILGRVCMDQMIVDVTNIKDAREDDRVTLIGQDGDEEITTDFLGELSGRFNYELVCNLTPRVPRIYIYNGFEY